MPRPPLSKEEINLRNERGAQLEVYRTIAGFRRKEMAHALRTNLANYSRMEKGEVEILAWHVAAAAQMFESWRKAEIDRLNGEINRLQSITKTTI